MRVPPFAIHTRRVNYSGILHGCRISELMTFVSEYVTQNVRTSDIRSTTLVGTTGPAVSLREYEHSAKRTGRFAAPSWHSRGRIHKIRAGDVVPLDIEVWPSATLFEAGTSLQPTDPRSRCGEIPCLWPSQPPLARVGNAGDSGDAELSFRREAAVLRIAPKKTHQTVHPRTPIETVACASASYALTRICFVEYIKRVESVFEVIAEPNRRAILSLLVSSQQSVGEIERQLRMTQPTVSKHLRVLR